MMELQRRTHLPELPERPEDGHKGLFGRVLIVGGSEGMIGAPAMAGLAALRMGCGLAYVAANAQLLPFVLTVAPELVGIPATEHSFEGLEKAIESADAIVCGPGLGQSEFSVEMLQRVVGAAAPLLLDADALNLIGARKVALSRPPFTTVLTPHPGEMKRLAGLFGENEVPSDEQGRIRVAQRAADYFQQVIVLKGHRTVITDGRQFAINTTGDSTLAKAGSGDVLSGMTGTLLGQKLNPFDAAWLATHYHGRAGELAGVQLGRRCALARDVISSIPAAIQNA